MDEHVPSQVTAGLRRRGVDVLRAQDAGLIQADDEVHLQRARDEKRIVFTQDADFLRLHAAGITHCGIAYAPQGTSVRHLVRQLLLLVEVMTTEEMVSHVEYL